jgi:hypothetical protein
MKKKEILLPTKRFFKADEEDVTLNVKLDNNETLMREGERNIILDLPTLFDDERNQSKTYKIYGKMKMVFRNMYNGYTDYNPMLKNFYLCGDGTGDDLGFVPYNEFALLRNDVLREVITPYSGNTMNIFVSSGMTLEGTRHTGHTTTTSIEAPYKNWNLYLSYVYGQDTGFTMNYTFSGGTNYTFVAGDGIPFRVTDGGNYFILTSPVEHGMLQGEYITISGGTLNSSVNVTGRTFYIESVGNETYDSEKYVINLQKNEFSTGLTLNGVTFVLGKRCLSLLDITGTTSQYYVHKHKTLTTVDDYIMDKVGFETPIWEHERKILFENPLQENDVLVERNRPESILYDFKKTFTLTGITNNLGYTPTEVYITVLLRNGNGYFTYPPKVGYKFNFHNTWVDNQFSGDTSIEKGLTGYTTTFTGKKYTDLNVEYNYTGVTFTGGTTGTTLNLNGAFVEYNKKDFKERIISEAFHKFSHNKTIGSVTIFNHGQDNTNPEGYFYQPHYRVKLRELSPYIETSKTKDILNLPENTIYDEKENLWRWRDLYDHGFLDQDGNGTNFPFINNLHYVVKDINFYLRNEKLFTNKTDGLNNFNNINPIDC